MLRQSHSEKKKSMPLVSSRKQPPGVDMRQSDRAMDVRTGLIRGLVERNWSFVAELGLSNGRRADLVAMAPKGEIHIFEIKSSVEDFRADTKWHEYKDHCDFFYFATLPDVPVEIFPETEGFLLADRHGCDMIRDATENRLGAARRKSVTLRFARTAANRLLDFTLQGATDRLQ